MNKQALSEIAERIKIYSEAQSKRQRKSIEDEKGKDQFLQFKREAEKDRLHKMRMEQMFITAMQHQKHSTQSSNSYSPRGN